MTFYKITEFYTEWYTVSCVHLETEQPLSKTFFDAK
jgi:hypothetical protein